VNWTLAAAATAGVLAAGWIRAQVFIHSVPPQRPWRTACPHCNQPVITFRYGWAWLPHSRCRSCGSPIGPRATVVEIVTASMAAALASTVHGPLAVIAFLAVAVAGTALALTDLAVQRLPDRLTLPAFVTAAALLAVDAVWQHRITSIAVALAGAAASAGVHLLLALVAAGGVGDVKLAMSTGLILGWLGWAPLVLGTVAGFGLTSLGAAALVLAGRRKRGDYIAHGPGMIAAALAVTIISGAT
jgi:leader peptidase (prepilin peptidase)/N-methyltransferase